MIIESGRVTSSLEDIPKASLFKLRAWKKHNAGIPDVSREKLGHH